MVAWRGWTARLAGLTLVAGGVSGCDRPQAAGQTQESGSAAVSASEPVSIAAAQQGPGLHLAYTHEIALAVAASVLDAHFTAARDRCLKDPVLHCLLLHAEIGLSQQQHRTGSASERTAALRMRLPHDQVVGFAGQLTAPLSGEAAGLITVARQSTTAEDVGLPVADAAQRVAELGGYLASLKNLGARLTISVADQVKIAEETARAQTQMEEAQSRQRELALRVDTEEIDVSFTAKAEAGREIDPITRVLEGAQASLRRNAADALAFGIAAVPWVPVGLAGLIVLWVARRLVFGRRRVGP